MKYLLVGVGGALGSVLRFWASSYIAGRVGSRFPYGTFVVNISGSFLIGLALAVLAETMDWGANWRYLISIGFIGGYTTFSAFEYETFRLFQSGRVFSAILNVTLSVVVGFLAVWAGWSAGGAMAMARGRVSGGKVFVSQSAEEIAVCVAEEP